ncbi:thiamine pyrophosphate-binding protein [Blautia sp. CLA-JM-H16]|uniref:Thiamine pyrophosphate-binding protein n=1 Tax=Blautia aquisgranensis TaxID=3133153 RepID=A0ABV1BI19_9FIRM
MSKIKLTDYVTEFLQRKGIHDFFGYQGTMIAHLVDSIEHNPNTRSHSSYNEQGAAFAACGYAQAKDACACAYATSGPGAVNLLSGVADAYFDSLPIIFITGQLNTYEYSGINGLRQQGFQEIDIVSMAKPVTKYAVQIREPQDIIRELNLAWQIANTGRKGPVLIDLPMNVQRGEVCDPVYDMEFPEEETETAVYGQKNSGNGAAFYRKAVDKADSADADVAAEDILCKLRKARRPVFMIGHGAAGSAEKNLVRIAREHHIPVITSVLARSVLSWDDPLNCGCIGGAYGHRYANMIANAKSDLLVCFGISLCTRQIGTKVHEFAKNAEIVRVDIDPYNLQREIHEGGKDEKCFCVSAEEVAEKLLADEKEIGSYGEWLSVCQRIRKELTQVDDATPERYPNRMIAYLSGQLGDTGAVAVDVGQHMVWSYQSFHNKQNQKLLFSGGHGAMGYALPAAIGAYYATGKPVACICGDGAFQMNIQELQWVKRENIPVKMIVMNNEALGMIRHLQRDYFDCVFADTSDGSGFSSCAFADVAKAYGIPSKRIQREEVEDASGEFLEQNGPGLLEIMLENGTYAYPKTCLGEPIHNQQPYIPKQIFDELMEI